MKLRGQQCGYAMAALLVGLGIMSVMLTVAMPVWTQMARREKEAELVFRGEQYKRALDLFQRRNGPGVTPPSVDALVEGRFLRKEFTDPITGEDFLLLRQGAATETPGGSPQNDRGVQAGGGAAGSQTGSERPGFASGGIVGVASRSTEESLRTYNGRTRYDEWDFTFVQQTQTPGAGAGGPGGPGGPGARGGPPGPLGAPSGGIGGRGQGRGTPPNGPAPGGRGLPVGAPNQGGRGQAPPPQPAPR